MKSFVYQSEKYGYQLEFEVNNWAERSFISLLTKFKDSRIFTTLNFGSEIPLFQYFLFFFQQFQKHVKVLFY